jgi:two-component system, chemotaxis family, CheB/CheR fusion protein
MEFGELRQVAALNQRIRRVLSVFRTVAAHMGTHNQNSRESALHLSGRIGAIGRAVLAPVFFDGIDLESLILDELRLHAAHPEQSSVSGPEVRLTPKSAELMSLVIHELATNAVKYGALSQSRAKIQVAWEIEYRFGSQSLYFEWREAGVRMMSGAPFTPGFGYELVERLIARELKGEGKMVFLPDGVRCTIEIPLVDLPSP